MKNKRIVVVGGGPSGVAAAYSASMEGAEVILIERYGFLGGMATAGLVHPWMTYYAGNKPIIKGFFGLVVKELKKRKGYKDSKHFKIKHHCFDHEALKNVLLEFLLKNKVKILFHTYFCSAAVKKNKIKSVTVLSKSGFEEINGAFFIDSSGDGDLAAMAGVPYEKGRPEDGYMQPMTLHFRMGGVDIKKMPSREEINKIYNEAKLKGQITCPRENLLWFDTVYNDQIHFNTTRIIKVDGTKNADLTYAEIEGRRQMNEIIKFLKNSVPGFEKSYLLMSAPQIGVRETRRIMGEYVLTEDDILNLRRFNDCICHNSYSIDIHNPKGTGTVIKNLPKGGFHDIPFRSLIPKGIKNLLVCGRPISSTHEAHSSIRIQPVCYATGQAAGAGAYLCTKERKNPSKISIKKLQKILLKQGAFLKLL